MLKTLVVFVCAAIPCEMTRRFLDFVVTASRTFSIVLEDSFESGSAMQIPDRILAPRSPQGCSSPICRSMQALVSNTERAARAQRKVCRETLTYCAELPLSQSC